ncbi:cytochrome b5 reductase 4-like isoform X3 [Penaeus japonicus]|uniref:cytochrome b5 reductase 4-like isoform X3 n=1 Tax=Penaeus japonicus TaxID=27405 RepID=UPI001C70C476|nr:cytochrome b5 reductase 4-like isoform X3 [Penaeus japonicus]
MGTVLGRAGQANGVAVAPTGPAEGNPRNKTALKPGRSLMDWVRLGHSGADLAGTGGRLLEVTPQELAKHKKRNDCWMALKGKVYNITPYMEFHPGGEDELLRGVGMDATDLFNEVHKWVNFESMLQKCLIGRLVEARPFFLKPSFLPLGKSSKDPNKQSKVHRRFYYNASKNLTVSSANNSLAVPSLGLPGKLGGPKSPMVSPQTPSSLPNPKYDWFQTNTMINIAIYTKWKHITKDHVVIVKRAEVIKVVCYIQDMVYTVHLSLHKPVGEDFDLKIGSGSGKVDVLLNKQESGVRWSSVGKPLERNGEHVSSKDRAIEYLECSLISKENMTHDTRMFIVEVPRYAYLPVPIGYHVYLRIQGKDVVKPYTPVTASLKVGEEEEVGRKIYIFIKIYEGGALTPALDELPIGSSIDVSFPEGTFTPDKLTAATVTATDVALLAAGTGITPMIRVMLAALQNEKRVHLILFNKTEEDIPWKEELNTLLSDHSSLLKVTHVLSKAEDSWSGLRGHIRQDLLEDLLPKCEDKHAVHLCVCGPTVFTKLALNLFKDVGYSDGSYHAFLG